jgi:predicted HTH domain antitoxin
MTLVIPDEILQTDLPNIFSRFGADSHTLVTEMRLAAAVKWFELGLISQAKAAELAGLSRQEFINSLGRFQVSPIQMTPEELTAEFLADEPTLGS